MASSKKHHSRKRPNERFQIATEFLVTYGWALVIIAAVVATLFYFGFFSPRSSLPPTIISGFQGTSVTAAASNGSLMVLALSNSRSSTINLSSLYATLNGVNYTTSQCLTTSLSPGQSTICTISGSFKSEAPTDVGILYYFYNGVFSQLISSTGTISTPVVPSYKIPGLTTAFVETGLFSGVSWSVTYNSVQKSTTSNSISFSNAIGNYSFSVPASSNSSTQCTTTYTPSPSSGYLTTGSSQTIAFSHSTSCITTFSETGLPSGKTWNVTYNGQTLSASTGSSIQFTSAPTTTTATAKIPGYSCSESSSVAAGSSYTFSSWSCVTTFSESALPANGASWSISFAGGSNTNAVSSPPSQMSVSSTVSSIATTYAAAAGSNYVDCNSYYSATPGTSGNAFSSWNCTTVFKNGLPSGYSGNWGLSYDGSSQYSSAVSGSISIPSTTTNVSVADSYSGSTASYSCTTSNSADPGGTVTVPWSCITTFRSGNPSGYSTAWSVSFNGGSNSPSSLSTNATITTGPASTSYTASMSSYACSNSSSTLAGSTVTVPWSCKTTFNSGVSGYSGGWSVSFDGSSDSPSGLSTAAVISTSPASAGYSNSMSSYSCSGSSSTLAGSTVTVPWSCTTTFTETNLPSGKFFNITGFDGKSGSSTTSSVSISGTGTGSYTFNATGNNPSSAGCFLPSLLSAQAGANYAISPSSWECVTEFINNAFGTTNFIEYQSTDWTIKYDGVRQTSAAYIISIKESGAGTFSFGEPFTTNNVLCYAPSGSTVAGVQYYLTENWNCDIVLAPSSGTVYEMSEFYNKALPSQTISGLSSAANQSVVYDNTSNVFFVSSPQNNEIYMFNGSTGAVELQMTTPGHPTFLFYKNNLLFVVYQNGGPTGTASVGVWDVANARVGNVPSAYSTNTSLGPYIDGMGYNPATGNLWITQGCNVVSCAVPTGDAGVFVVQTDTSATYVNKLGIPPGFSSNEGMSGTIAYDPNGNDMYIAGLSGVACTTTPAGLDAYNASSAAVVATGTVNEKLCPPLQGVFIPFIRQGVGRTDFIYYDNAYFGFSNASNLPSSGYTEIGNTPTDGTIFYDGSQYSGFAFNYSDVYVISSAELSSSGVSLYAVPANNQNFPVQVNYSVGSAYTVGGTVTMPTVTTFVETGLPSGTSWTVSYAGTSNTDTVNNLNFIVPPGESYSYSISSPCVSTIRYSPSPSSGTASSGSIISVSFSGSGSGAC